MWRFFKKLLTVTGIFWFPSYILRKNNWKKKSKSFTFDFLTKIPQQSSRIIIWKVKKPAHFFPRRYHFQPENSIPPLFIFFGYHIFPISLWCHFGDLNHIFIMRLYNTSTIASWLSRSHHKRMFLTERLQYN